MTSEWSNMGLEYIFPTELLTTCGKIHLYFKWKNYPIYTKLLFTDVTYLDGNICYTQWRGISGKTWGWFSSSCVASKNLKPKWVRGCYRNLGFLAS